MRALLLIALLMPAPALAAECPPSDPALAAARAPLFGQLRTAPDEATGRRIAGEIWSSWNVAPDAMAQDFLDRGIQKIAWQDLGEAERLLGELIAYCPAFPEGWNQRAFARYLGGDLEGAMADLDETLALEPRHFGALAGKALTLFRMEKLDQGQAVLREALDINPWLSERHLLTEPPGKRI